MNNDELREKLIGDCLEKRLPKYAVNKILIKNGLKALIGGEADCYDVMLNSSKKTNPRKKIISSCLIKGLSKIEANMVLYDKKFRRLSEEESYEYEDVLSRIRYCGKGINEILAEKKQKVLTSAEIIQNGIYNELSVEEVNKKLRENGYQNMTSEEENKFRTEYNQFHNKRQGIIQHAFEELKTVKEVNQLLKDNGLTILTMVEELNYQKEKERINLKNRENLIKECIEERLEIFEINIILNKNGFEKLSEQETDRIQNPENKNKKTKRKTSELSNQFRNLYRLATKKFHPDKFSDKNEKETANKIMKEINEAKEKNDFFMLKDIVAKYEKIFAE